MPAEASLAAHRTTRWSTRVEVVVTEPSRIVAATRLLDHELDRVEELVSRFRPDSELSRLHRRVDDTPAAVSAELCEAIGLDKLKVGAVLSRLVRESIDTPRRAHICAYTHDAEGARSYPRAVYALGDRPNVPKPKARPAVNSRRYRAGKPPSSTRCSCSA